MTQIEKLHEERARLQAEIGDVDSSLAELDENRRLQQLQAALDDAVSSGDDQAIDEAARALQAAQTGSDEASRTMATLKARRRVLERSLAENAAAEQQAIKERLQAEYEAAQAALEQVRDEYEAHARALVELYPRLMAHAVIRNDAQQRLGKRPTTAMGLFTHSRYFSLPRALNIGLPPELSGEHGNDAQPRMQEILAELRSGATKAEQGVQTGQDVGRNVGDGQAAA